MPCNRTIVESDIFIYDLPYALSFRAKREILDFTEISPRSARRNETQACKLSYDFEIDVVKS